MLEFIKELLKERFIELTALGISIVNLFLYYNTLRKQKVNLSIVQDEKDAFNFKKVQYETYQCLFFHVNICNKSKSDTSITKIELVDSTGNSFDPSHYDLKDYHNGDGLTLYEKGEGLHGYTYNLSTENILHTLRIPSYGNIKGYLVFFDVLEIQSSTTYTLRVHTPKKIFKQKIIVNPLPDSLTVKYP